MKRESQPKDIDDYLKRIPRDNRIALENLRKTIRSVAPDAMETISYGMPAFKYHGPLVYFAAFKEHVSFFVGSKATTKQFSKDLSRFDISPGTIRFTPEHPIPAALVKRIVKARIIENETRAQKKKQIKRIN